jgi:hypothetical protein
MANFEELEQRLVEELEDREEFGGCFWYTW